MFEFFIALFGGLFYAGKLLSDKAQRNEAKWKYDRFSNINESIRNIVEASYELREKTKDRLLRHFGKPIDEINAIYNELEDDFKYVFGDDVDIRKQLYLIPNYNTSSSLLSTPGIKRWAYDLLLAHQGKVDWRSYSYGFQLGGIKTVDRDIRFCRRIEHLLNANGVDLKLYLKPQYSTYTESYDWNPCGKTMVFEHQLFEHNGKRLW